ncbi:MAG: phosphatidylinositol dimannoside acyltransferase [Chloroflexota bacterium]|nr:phosphatidylinositol dimannoside acyltransferase [Chloroflexota bacterium]
MTSYRGATWLLGVLPATVGRAAIGRLSQASYLALPSRRRWSNQNYGHVLGLPPDDPRVRRLALRAYREYGRYLVELMRLPTLPPDEVSRLVADLDAGDVRRIWAEAPGGLILAAGHVGNNEAVAAGIAHHGLPISVVADDTGFPELYDLLRRQREGWGVRMIPWRNLREIFGVLKRREMLALLVDWGYRSDGIPVQLLGAWTTMPAGPATLAAKTGSRILPIGIKRNRAGGFEVSWGAPIDVASTGPAELQRATQAMANALGETIRSAPDQWYNFKPIWPAGEAEAADLARRGACMQQGLPDPGPRRGLPRDEADGVAPEAVA